MIQSTGVIPAQDGISEYKNALINVSINSNSKFNPTTGIAQVGKLIEHEEGVFTFHSVSQIGTYDYNDPNPSFEQVQLAVLNGLMIDYPNVQFKIV